MKTNPKTQQTLVGGTVEDHRKGEKLFEALADLFFRPIIGHRGWEDSITEEQRGRIKLERLKQLAESKGEKIEMATDYEAMVYLSTASLAQPLSPSLNRVYFHLFKKFYPDNSDFIEDYEAKLDIQAEQELKNLKRWLLKASQKR